MPYHCYVGLDMPLPSSLLPYIPVFSPAKIEDIGEGNILGGASVHIKGFGSTPIPLQKQISTEGIGAPIP